MTDAQTLYRAGVTAIREQKNLVEGRRLLTESLRLDPENDMAWVWLSRTVADPMKQGQCLDRALRLNPNNRHALTLREQLAARSNGAPPSPPLSAPASIAAMLPRSRPDASKNMEAYLTQAQKLLDAGDVEGAIEQWVRVLREQPDHELALGSAVRQLSRLKYFDDAKELVWRALDAGTTHPSIYLTAIDLLRREGKHSEADDLRRRLAVLPAADDALVSDIVDYFLKSGQVQDAQEILTQAIATHPKSQKLLIRLGDLYTEFEDEHAARGYYEQAARLGLKSSEGRLADTKLGQFKPTLSDRERGSTLLALREAVGIGVFFLLLGWQDAGLDLLHLGTPRWAGVGLGLLGGYLLVTATSSPQQQPLARWLGGQAPANPDVSALPVLPLAARLLFGVGGLALLALAFYLVFATAIGLLTNPTPPAFYIPSINEIFD